ncbi:MAG: PQQ-binding-like beta-propeller repeat protein, partial [Thermoanaerobaculia bacterium]|nr:PQQ-binding-like beta-propeller repeat protein [Thermoanaerobaculia bacterium]
HRYYAFDKRTGEVVWMSTPGGDVYDRNTQSVPVVAVVGERRLLIGGNADGHVYALEARTGRKVWQFELSKRGINVSPVVAGDRVFISHSEENVDEGTLGRVVAIDATGSGDVTASHELWRRNLHTAGFPSPAYHDGRLYVVDNSGNLTAVEAASGELLWELSLGTVGKASPVWADGKIYAGETNGHFAIVRAGDREGEILARHQLTVASGRYAELYGSAAIAYGRIYFTTEEGLYCLGAAGADFAITRGTAPDLGDEGKPEGPATLLLTPAEVVAAPGDTVEFQAHAFDAKGRSLGTVRADLSLAGLSGELSGRRLRFGDDAGFQAGTVVAKAEGLEASARVRVFPPLPWSEDFSQGRRGWWIGAGRYTVRGEGEEAFLAKPVAESGLLRSHLFLGPPSLSDYTIQVDMKPAQKGRRRTDGGLVNSGYILDLLGIHQRVQIRSWTAEMRIDATQDFEVEMDRWYTMKLKVSNDGNKALIQGKVWPRGEAEPAEWTVTAEDPHPILAGAPAITGYSPAEISFDNVLITEN